MDKQYKLSPSDFAYLWNDCKHCYYQKVKIGLRYYITADLILQLNIFKDYLEKVNPFLFLEVFGKQRKNDRELY